MMQLKKKESDLFSEITIRTIFMEILSGIIMIRSLWDVVERADKASAKDERSVCYIISVTYFVKIYQRSDLIVKLGKHLIMRENLVLLSSEQHETFFLKRPFPYLYLKSVMLYIMYV